MIEGFYESAKEKMQAHIERFRPEILGELRTMMGARPATKDILVVVYNQLDFVRNCIESVRKNTKDYHLYIWDNASDQETRDYLRSALGPDMTIHWHDSNIGFGVPNNELARLGEGEYLILLNSDTQVMDGWDRAMIGHLQSHTDCAQVGYLGCLLDEKGYGGRVGYGAEIDYVCGFCTCISRETYRQFGLFDEVYRFAYCEDADLSLRLQDAEKSIYALHLLQVHHFENQTIKSVVQEGKIDTMSSFLSNHDVLRARWADYLSHRRIDLKKELMDGTFGNGGSDGG